MDGPKSHRELVVWQKALRMAVAVYRITAVLPREETFALRSQMTRAAASVPANIAEGYGRGSRREYARFVSIAKGSAAEVDTFLVLGQELGYFTAPQIEPIASQLNEIERMLAVLRMRLIHGKRA
jgi:four helix bundle protein